MAIFTFGAGHTCGCGRSLRDCYTELPSRERMVELWGVKWSHEYVSRAHAGVFRFGLWRIVTDEDNPDCRCGGMGREQWEIEQENKALEDVVFGSTGEESR